VIFPIGDLPNPRGFVPLITYLLIALNVGIYWFVTLPLSDAPPAPNDPLLREYMVVMAEALRDRARLEALFANLSAYDLFVFRWGFRPAAPSLATLVSSIFLHAGFVHLAGNMLFLWIYGDNVEHRLGRVRFLVAYLLSGIAATLFHTVSSPGSPIPMVGASGAISGVLGFYFLFFPRNRVRLLWFLPPFIFQVFEVPARIVLGFYILLDNLLPYLLTTSDAGVAHGAHIGGFIAGFGAAWVMSRREVSHRPEEYASIPLRDRAAGEEIGPAIAAGRYEDAARDYFALPADATMRLLSPARGLDLARWLSEHGHLDAALVVLRRLIRDFPAEPKTAEVCVLAGDLLLGRGQGTAAYQYYLTALDLVQTGPVAEAARRGIAEIESAQKRVVRWG
jgi:membrane associated rhomboid family serine protease